MASVDDAAPTLGLASGRVVLVPHDPRWADAFAREASRMRAAFGGLPAEIAHVGSTAGPGIAAKPILDVMIGRPPDDAAVAPYVAALEAIGYTHRGPYGIPGRNYFVCDDTAGRRTHHVHMVALDGPFWRRHLAFRDHLRAHPERAAAYDALKRALAERHSDERGEYTDGKTAFIRATVRLAGVDSGPDD
ncbi:MAG: GrpB family protein [Gemmatirosa sp.]